MPWTRRTDRWTGNIFVLLTEENIWSICQFGSCQVWRKVHSVTLSAWLASRTWARLTNTTSKSPCLLFYSFMIFFMSFVICMYICAAIFSQEKGKCVDSHTCGYVGGGSTELVVRPVAGTIKMWQIKIPANCQQLSGLWSWDWCLYWCLRSPDGEAVNNIKQNIYLSKLHCCHQVHT